jgi:hypothetical protein
VPDGHAVLATTIRTLPGIQPDAAEHMIGVYAALGMPSVVAHEVAPAIRAQPLQMAWACNQEYSWLCQQDGKEGSTALPKLHQSGRVGRPRKPAQE